MTYATNHVFGTLDELNVSCGEYHQEFVPLASVANAYRAAVDLDYKTVLLAGEFLAEGKGRWTPKDFWAAVGEELLPPDLQSPFVNFRHGMSCGAAMCSGRGEHFIKREDVISAPLSQIKSRCSDVLTAITAHPNGNLTACCGVMVREDSLLTIGNWRKSSLKTILEAADQDVILNWIKYVGLKDMRQWLQAKDPSLHFRDTYTNICDLCQELMYNDRCQELLVAHAAERQRDVVTHRLAVEVAAGSDGTFRYGPADLIEANRG